MCGASQDQKDINKQQIAFMNQLQTQYASQYADNKAIMDTLTSTLKPIVDAGINQEGFSPAELNALNGQAIQQSGQAYAQEKQALGESMAGAGGGQVFMPSAATESVKASLAASAENNLSNQKLGITSADFATGRQNYTNAVGMLAGVPGAIGSANNGASGAVVNSGSAAASEANSIQAANSSWMGLVGGLAGSLGGAAIGKIK